MMLGLACTARTVHPRWRGEHSRRRSKATLCRGSSPLARGTLSDWPAPSPRSRFIPAGAGNTQWNLKSQGQNCGSSPLARGTHCRRYPCPIPSPVHPRWRGEHVRRSPRLIRVVRFIPAGAGNTAVIDRRTASGPVHPRWRGEHIQKIVSDRPGAGSSPLARGTPSTSTWMMCSGRFIPAGAGNTPGAAAMTRAAAVHPRWRGEHGVNDPAIQGGSRFIPAGAGNTVACPFRRRGTTVHPRWRGEHPWRRRHDAGCRGSSPLARGTLQSDPPQLFAARFIPAGAGNTCRHA